MHLVMISGATRPQPVSNTAKIISAFKSGFEEEGNTAEVWYLSDRRQWAGAAKAFASGDSILIALPLYVENIPGILLEFLSGLKPKTTPGTRIAFLLQGGFPEASQSRCCEAYLKTLPAQLGCEYSGTLIKGDMFGLGMMDEKNRQRLLAGFTEMPRSGNDIVASLIISEYRLSQFLGLIMEIAMFSGRMLSRIKVLTSLAVMLSRTDAVSNSS